jgi:predicted membrane channel-forming protein YqfA (hemolysin III family)
MTLLMFGIIVLVLCCAAYILYRFVPDPPIFRTILYVVFGLILVFLVLDLFHLYPLPFSIK